MTRLYDFSVFLSIYYSIAVKSLVKCNEKINILFSQHTINYEKTIKLSNENVHIVIWLFFSTNKQNLFEN